MITKKILIILIINLYFHATVFASDSKPPKENSTNAISVNVIEKNDQENSIINIGNEDYHTFSPEINSNTELLNTLQSLDAKKKILVDILDNELNNPDFNRINGNYIAIKLFIFVLAILSSGSDDLLITNNKKITAEIILAIQMGVPIYTESMYLVFDSFMLEIKDGIINIIKKALQNKWQSVFTISKIGACISLAYFASVIEIDASGDGYRWLFTHATSNNTILSSAYYYGYYSHLLFSLNLYSVFFYQLIDELLSKTAVGYLLKSHPAPTENFNQLETNM